MPAKAVHLISPGYRRWLTPDFADLEFELEGFDPKDATPWQAHVFVRDLDADAETQSITPLDGTPKTFTLPAPKFHRRAEVILFLEDRRTKEPAVEGRWRLTNIPKEDLPNLSYFDARGVFFHEGVGRFPLIAFPTKQPEPAAWEAFAKAGFTGLAVPQHLIDDRSAETARSLKLLLFAMLGSPTDRSPERRKADVRRLMRYPAVAGYSLAANPATLSACRMADPSRPVVTTPPQDPRAGDLPAEFADFQDVVAILSPPPPDAPRRPRCMRFGRAHLGWIGEDDLGAAGVTPHLLTAVARGASAFVVRGESAKLTAAPLAASLRDAAPVVNAVVRGIPEPGDEAPGLWTWRRRLGPNERAVIEVKRTDPPAATFTIHRE